MLLDPKSNFSLSFPLSWTYGSNSLPTAGSVSGGVARRGQRQFQMPPRGLPAGRMGLLSPSGIGGASPRHTLTSPALASQGRQVSPRPGRDYVCHLERTPKKQRRPAGVSCICMTRICFRHNRTFGFPTLEAVTACRVKVAAPCSGHTPSLSTRLHKPCSCSSSKVRNVLTHQCSYYLWHLLAWTFLFITSLLPLSLAVCWLFSSFFGFVCKRGNLKKKKKKIII